MANLWPKLSELCEVAFLVYDTPVDVLEFEGSHPDTLKEVELKVNWGDWDAPRGILGPKTNTQAFHFERHGSSVFAFRGTEFGKVLKGDTARFQDVLIDMAVLLPHEYPPVEGGYIHRGFARAMEEVWPWISAEIARVRHSEITFVGHSLGGALATVAALRTVDELNVLPRWVFTFGSPRVANTAVAKHYNQLLATNTIRCVNDKDFVSRVPVRFPVALPDWMGFNWSHVGQPVLLNQSAEPSTDWLTFLQQSFDEVIQGWRSGTIKESGADHLAYREDILWNRHQFRWPTLQIPDVPC